MQGASGRFVPERVIATYSSYDKAERAVDYLSDRGFPVERVSIVVEGLGFVEQATHGIGYGRTALYGASSGAVAGMTLGPFLALFSPRRSLVFVVLIALYGLVSGGVLGAAAGSVLHALFGATREQSAAVVVQAERYEIMAQDEVADEAARLLSEQH